MITGIPCPDLPATMVQQDAYRPVDWRWQRAVSWSKRNDRRGWSEEDAITRETAIALRERPWWYRPPSAFAARLARINAAQTLASVSYAEKVLHQAWLLTGAPVDQIAAQLHESVDALIEYERLFFDVRNRLDIESAIVMRVIGQQPPAGKLRVGWLLQWLAYFGGAHLLEAAAPLLMAQLTGKPSAGRDTSPPELRQYMAAMLIDRDQDGSPEMILALRPYMRADKPPKPFGDDWRSACHSQISAALAAETTLAIQLGHSRIA